MTDLRKDFCKGCGGPVLWARTEASGAWLSLDPEPVAEGNVTLVKGKAHVLTKAELGPPLLGDAVMHLDLDQLDQLAEETGHPWPAIDSTPRYVPHRATCTNWPGSNKR